MLLFRTEGRFLRLFFRRFAEIAAACAAAYRRHRAERATWYDFRHLSAHIKRDIGWPDE